jgi:putative membrane protein
VAFKGIVAGLIIIIAIYSLILVVESPIPETWGWWSGTFITVYSTILMKFQAMAKLLKDMVNQLTPGGLVSFKGKNGIKDFSYLPVSPRSSGNHRGVTCHTARR